MKDEYILKFDTDLDPRDLKKKLEQWEPWAHRIDFSNGVSTKDCKHHPIFTDNTLSKISRVEQVIPFDALRGGYLLDLGCHTGHNAIYCARKYELHPTGVDIRPRHIEVSQFLADMAGMQGEFVLESAETFSRPSAFDVVLHFGLLYHLQNPLLSLERTYENLKPGGYLALETQIYDHPEDKNICYFMHMHNNDRTNYWALSTKILNDCLGLIGFEQIKELFRVAPPYIAERMSRVILTARKPARQSAAITASPNPVPLKAGSGKTVISWCTAHGSEGEVYVSVDGKDEKLFTRGASGSQEANWIQTGKTYEFRLYSGQERTKLLAAVTVTGGSSEMSLGDAVKKTHFEDRAPSGIKVFRIRNYTEFLSHAQMMSEEYARYRSIEDSLRSKNNQAFSVKGFSYPAGKSVEFYINDHYASDNNINWREQVVCPVTRLNNRLRASVHFLDIELAPYPGDIIYLSEQTTSLYSFLRKRYSNLIGSEYLGDWVDLGDTNEDGIRNEDLTRLTLSDNSIDYVLSFECFEHIPEYLKAFKECCRVLKPKGKMLWSVPFIQNNERNTIRARIKPDGSIEHLLEPEYHGDPLNQADNCLCFTHFGWEILREVKFAGFSDAYAVLFWSLEFGYLGGEQILFVATK